MVNFRVVKFFILITLISSKFLFAQENNIESEKLVDIQKRVFYKVPKKSGVKIFKKAVNEHILKNKGIKDFYAIPSLEKEWLNKILLSEKEWHNQLLKLESDYRNAFQNFVGLRSGQNDEGVLIANYKKNIEAIKKDIDEIRRQIVQINVDQQVYINSLRTTPISTLVAIQTIHTPNLVKIKEKLGIPKNSIFKSLEDPVMAHISRKYSKNIKTPFKTGNINISYMYPENITLFDSKANEIVFLFLRVEGYPFSNIISTNIVGEKRDLKIQIFSEIDQINSYLKTKKVGDKRLNDWLKKEFIYQNLSNKYILDSIEDKLNNFNMFRNGLNENIKVLNSKVEELEIKKDLVLKKGTIELIEKKYIQSRNFYNNFFAKRQVLTHEKYTLENDVMYSFLRLEGEAVNNPKLSNGQIKNPITVSNISISGRPLKNIFSDIIVMANKKRNFNLQNYRERIYRPNEELTQLIQGELEWEIENEEFSILKLTKGNVGSRSHFVVHLAKITNLKSIPGFPAEKSGICKATLLFKRGKDIMRDSQKPILNRFVKCLRKYPQQMIRITGHTDPLKPNYGEGSKYNNVILGLMRAEKMAKELTRLKFNPGRFIVVSRGAQVPVAIGKSNKELQKNRRVELISKPKF